MASQTNNFSLFISEKGNNAGDLGKPLNDNFIIIDEILWKIRTNYKGDSPTTVPVGGLIFDNISEKLYYKVSSGLKEIGSGTASGGSGSSYTTEDLLFLLTGAITTNELSTDLNSRIDQSVLNLQESIDAKNSAIQAATDAIAAKADAIKAANDAAGFKIDAYDWSETSKSQAALASGYAETASVKASEAESSAGAAGISAQNAENSKVQAGIYNSDAKQSADAAVTSETNALSYKTNAETAAQSAYQYSVNAQIGAQDASGYANSAFNSSEIASTKATDAETYAIAAQSASGAAETAAGKAEIAMLEVASVSGDIISASTSAQLSAENASGYAQQSYLYSVDASGYAQQAHSDAELVASYLGAAESSGSVGLEAEVRASEDAALAQAITTAGTTYKGQTTLIQTQQESIDGIKGTYSVKIDNNGYVAGFGLTSSLVSGGDGAYSSFVVLADKFAVVKPTAGIGETPTQIFVVDSNTGAVGVNGSLIAGQIYSKNWSNLTGSNIDLDSGSLIFGGWESPRLYIDSTGKLYASGAEIEGKMTITSGSAGFHNIVDRPLFKGSWDLNGIDYNIGDEVNYQGSTWGCLITHVSDNLKSPPTLPETSNTYWTLRSQKGDQGEQGEAYVVVIESSNGNVFKIGYSTNSTLIAHVFLNGVEVTDTIDSGRFRWRRVSVTPQDPPNDDATWNGLYQTGYKQISITTDSIYARATYNCDIMSN